MTLTVAIPTYNRNEILKRHLTLLMPQLTPECRLLIIDNCSPTPVIETIGDLLESYPEIDARVDRNRVNIGAGANMLRCIERCETEWIWVLSDDDLPKPDAVETIFKNIARNPECVFFNYATVFKNRQEGFITTGVDDFVERLDEYGNLVFISTGIFRASAMLPYLKYGYIYCYSWAPFVATLLHALGDDGRVCFSAEHIVEYHQADEKRWSYINWGLGMGTLLDAPMKPETRRRFAKKIVQSVVSLDFAVLIELAAAINSNRMKRREAQYIYDQICGRIYYFEHGLVRQLRIAAFRMMLWWPGLSYKLCMDAIRFIRRRKGKSEDVDALWAPDRLAGV
jgi:glycosyltransferase involved in cell wall biosynthesis